MTEHLLGRNPDNNESLQVLIPAGHWFGVKVAMENSYVLAGCTVSPGFEFNDFEMEEINKLLQDYPKHADIVRFLTR